MQRQSSMIHFDTSVILNIKYKCISLRACMRQLKIYQHQFISLFINSIQSYLCIMIARVQIFLFVLECKSPRDFNHSPRAHQLWHVYKRPTYNWLRYRSRLCQQRQQQRKQREKDPQIENVVILTLAFTAAAANGFLFRCRFGCVVDSNKHSYITHIITILISIVYGYSIGTVCVNELNPILCSR